MAQTKFYLDCRGVAEGKPAPMKIAINHKGSSAQLLANVKLLPDQWNGERVVKHPNQARLTAFLNNRKASVDAFISGLILSGRAGRMSAIEIKREFLISQGEEVPEKKKKIETFEDIYVEYMNSRTADKTKTVYFGTLKKLRSYDPKFSELTFEDIDTKWLLAFERELCGSLKKNSSNLHMRNIRAVFNYAIENEKAVAYPFRRIKIKPQATMDRSLSVEELRSIFRYPCYDWQQEYVDMFKLMFFLCGINIGDLAKLDAVHAGRIEYDRQKTHKHYSIKVEPEAQEIIDRYKGEKRLLSILDRYSSYQDYLHHMNNGLKSLGKTYRNGARSTGDALFPNLSTYYARYSWATVAAELDIPKETIAAALGHTTMDVTAIYIRTDMKKKIDAANRKVMDYVLYDRTD